VACWLEDRELMSADTKKNTNLTDLYNCGLLDYLHDRFKISVDSLWNSRQKQVNVCRHKKNTNLTDLYNCGLLDYLHDRFKISVDSLWNSRQKQVNVCQVQRKIRDLTPVEYR